MLLRLLSQSVWKVNIQLKLYICPFQATVPISWDGWADAVSGVALYQIEIYKFKHYGSGDTAVLDYKSEGPLLKLNFTTIPSPMPSVKLAESGLTRNRLCLLLSI